MQPSDSEEPLLIESRSRFVLHPVEHPEIYELGQVAEECLWTTGEVDLSRDLVDLKRLTEKQRHVIHMILAFFAASDGIVIENLCQNFLCKVKMPEARLFYGLQTGIETIHSKMYSVLIDVYVDDAELQKSLFNAVNELPSIKQKADWALSYIDADKPFPMQLLAFACVEGIHFSSSFAFIFYLKTLGILPGLTFSNELISRDEGLHTDFAVLLYTKHVVNKLDQQTAFAIVREAVDCEKTFVDSTLPDMLLGMNSKLMRQYVEFVADRLLTCLGYDKLYDSANPFDFMDNISIQTKSNFFEARVAEYKKSGVRRHEEVKAAQSKHTFTRGAVF